MPENHRIQALGSTGLANALPTQPELSSQSRWSGFVFERHSIEAGALPLHSLNVHCLLLPMGPQAVPYRCTLDGQHIQGDMVPGQVQFRAAGTSVATEWFAQLDGIFVAISPELIDGGLTDTRTGQPLALQSDLDPQDNPVLSQLILVLDGYLRGGKSTEPLYEDALRAAICSNIAANYAAKAPPEPLSAARALSRKALRRVQDFIHSHLTSDFGVRDIAQAACLSQFHLCRAYHSTTGHSLWQYVIQCRSALAFALLTAHPDDSLRQVAELSGFESYAQFIAAFRKWYGVTPSELRKAIE